MTDAVIVWGLIGLVASAICIAILARFYERSNRETSLVKTGIGGRKVIMDGGTIAIPYFHEVARVNMQTLPLEVIRAGRLRIEFEDLGTVRRGLCRRRLGFDRHGRSGGDEPGRLLGRLARRRGYGDVGSERLHLLPLARVEPPIL